MKKAIVLLSGGLDSATTLYWAKRKGFKCLCLIFDYGQRHRRELESARRIAQIAKCDYQIIKFSLPWKGSALLDKKATLSPGTRHQAPGTNLIPSTYVPARNTIFLSFAVSCAEAIAAQAIFIGANHIDFSGYPDCRPDYYRSFQKVIKSGTRAGTEGRTIRIITPLIDKTKAEIIKLGRRFGVPYELTWSCYQGGTRPCGRCDSCLFREKGFREAGFKDPLIKKPVTSNQKPVTRRWKARLRR
jgi:7-cyano-7-deazaguanine synthase